MEFRILGPLKVLDRGRDLTPARAKQRALLTALLLTPNEPVRRDRLFEAIWGRAPPPTALNALHGHVAALRKLLGPGRIETHGTGYLVRIDEGELDLARFELLLAEARLLEPEQRSRRLGDALALWRGSPLPDLHDESFAQHEIARLEELRLSAREDRIEADLALGRHRELVGELEPLVAGYPFRERLRGQLMLALYRCGRQADALHAFQEGRTALVDGLGIDPGPALQQLARQILNQDPGLDPEVVEQQEPRPDELEQYEERKLATILVAELNRAGERLQPERLRALQRTCSEAISDVLTNWGGRLERHSGDTVTALFGVPAVHENDAERAIRAALEMVERTDQLNRTVTERYGITVAIRIGAETSEVITDREDGVTGDAVGIAGRLAQMAEPGTILVGDRSHALTRRNFRFGDAVSLSLKARTRTVLGHPVLEARSVAEGPLASFEAPFVGRERELNRLSGLLAEALELKSPRLVLVYGTAGIGKSRLTLEFLDAVGQRHPEVRVRKGRCLAAGRGITYWALGEILRETFGIALDDPGNTAAERLRAGARTVLSGLALPDDELERTIFALAATASIALADNPLDRIEPREVADELERAWPRLATALAMQRPTILVVEDLHWAGTPLLQMLDRLSTRASGPLLLVATARPEFAESHPGFMVGREGATSITLEPLAEPQSATLVAGLLPMAELPEDLCGDIVRAAEGNPFFLEEIVLGLIDAGVIVRDGDRWRATSETAAIALPDTVHGVLAARIDALPLLEKRALQEAAVVGRVFWQGPLVRLLGGGVATALRQLEERSLVVARPTSSLTGEAEYQFKHALVRDVVYGGIPMQRRARAHAQHATWIEELAGERRDEFIELIAYHYDSALAGEDADLAWVDDLSTLAELRGQTFDAMLAAGDAARRRFAIDKALELHNRALVLADDKVGRAKALAAIGDDHEANFHGDEAFEVYEQALDVIREQPGTESLRAHVCFMASRMAAVKWGGFRTKPTPALMERLIDEGLEVATDESTRNWLTVLKGTVGLRWQWSGLEDPLALAERIRFAQAGVEVAERLDSPPLLSQAYRIHGLLQSLAGHWDVTTEIARRDLRLADRLEGTEQAFALFWNAIFLMEIAGEYVDNVVHAERSLDVARALTPHDLMHGTYTVMSARFQLGRWAELEGLAQEHLEALAKEPGIGCPYSRAGPLLAATALAHCGRLERAAELADAFEPAHDRPGLPEALLARYLVARGDPLAGRQLAERIIGRSVYAEENAFEILAMLEALVALEDWDALAVFLPRARSLSAALALIGPASDRAEAIMLNTRGERRSAERLLRRAIVGFERMHVIFEAALTKERLAAVCSNGDASHLRKEALAVYEQLNAAPHVERLSAARRSAT